VITVPERYTQTDGQTCDRNTALCTKVHRAVKMQSEFQSDLDGFSVIPKYTILLIVKGLNDPE